MSQTIHLQRFEINESPHELFAEVRLDPTSGDFDILNLYQIYDRDRKNLLPSLTEEERDTLDTAVAKRIDADEQDFDDDGPLDEVDPQDEKE